MIRPHAEGRERRGVGNHSGAAMKIRWQTKTLGEVCGFVRGPFGGSLKKSVFVEDGFAVYEQQHAIYNQFDGIRYFIEDAKFQEMQRFELRPNDLIMSCSGTMGKVAIVPEQIRRGIINQALLKLTPSSAILPEFLKYWMDSTDFQDRLKEQSGGAAIQNVASVGFLKEIPIPLPPLPEQQRIVRVLDEAFEGIATAKANAEKNLQNARALFESELESVFSRRGQGWLEKRLDAIAEFSQGIQVGLGEQSNSPGEGLVRFIRIIDYTQGTDDIRYVKNPGVRYWVDKSEIVMIRYGTPGLVGRGIEGVIANNLFKISIVDSSVTNDFLAYFLGRQTVQHYLSSQGSSTMPALTFKQLGEVVISFPLEIREQVSIVTLLDELREATRRLESIYQRKLAALDELKKLVLHQAFEGEL